MRALIIGFGSMGKRRVRCLKALGVKNINVYDVAYPADTVDDDIYFESNLDVVTWELSQGNFDVMLVCTPPLTKQKYIGLANMFNVPCFCEADVTIYGGQYAPSRTMVFHPAIKSIKKTLDSGVLGKIYTFNYHLGQHLDDWHPGCDMKKYYAAQCNTGACREMFAFELAWMDFLFGGLENATGCIHNVLNRKDILADEVYAASVQFGTGKGSFVGTVLIDIVTRPATRKLSISCENGTLTWDWRNGYFQIDKRDGGIWQIEFKKGKAAQGYNQNICEQMYVDEMRDFLMEYVLATGKYKYQSSEEANVIDVMKRFEGEA